MQLYDRGLLTLDGDVNKHLDFVLQNPSYPEVPVTMRQLLSHTSSIDDEQYSSRQVYDHSAMLMYVATARPDGACRYPLRP